MNSWTAVSEERERDQVEGGTGHIWPSLHTCHNWARMLIGLLFWSGTSPFDFQLVRWLKSTVSLLPVMYCWRHTEVFFLLIVKLNQMCVFVFFCRSELRVNYSSVDCKIKPGLGQTAWKSIERVFPLSQPLRISNSLSESDNKSVIAKSRCF